MILAILEMFVAVGLVSIALLILMPIISAVIQALKDLFD